MTVCAAGKKPLLTVGAAIGRPPALGVVFPLTRLGGIVEHAIQTIPNVYGGAVGVDCYVIMPNHIHMILVIQREAIDGRPMVAPTVSRVVQQMKGTASKKAGFPLWQKSFHDHVIRDTADYQRIAEYIQDNPFLWNEDTYYKEVSP